MRPRTRLLPVVAPVGTTALVVALLALKPSTDPALETGLLAGAGGEATSPVAPVPTGPPPGTAASSSTRPSATASTSKPRATPTGTKQKTATTTSSPSPAKTSTASPTKATTLTVTGATITTKYGPVQVRITVRSGRITSADAIQYPDETARSRELSSKAIPILDDEAVAAQSANIATVSGATYTSGGYKQSLQSAIDRAGL